MGRTPPKSTKKTKELQPVKLQATPTTPTLPSTVNQNYTGASTMTEISLNEEKSNAVAGADEASSSHVVVVGSLVGEEKVPLSPSFAANNQQHQDELPAL